MVLRDVRDRAAINREFQVKRSRISSTIPVLLPLGPSAVLHPYAVVAVSFCCITLRAPRATSRRKARIAVNLETRGAQAGCTVFLKRGEPAGELFTRQPILLAGIVDADLTALHGSYQRGLAAWHPSRVWRWQRFRAALADLRGGHRSSLVRGPLDHVRRCA